MSGGPWFQVVLSELRELKRQVTESERKLDMITQAMQDGQTHILEQLAKIASDVEVLAGQVGNGSPTPEGATEDEVLGLLSPISSAAGVIVDRLSELTGGGGTVPGGLSANAPRGALPGQVFRGRR